MIPLKTGRENPPVQFETLLIEPINLFVQSKPWNDSLPHIQLELSVAENNKKYSTFLCYYGTDDEPRINYPKAFENYIFSLEINTDSINLIVEKLDFGKDFFIDFGQKAVIENITVSFEKTVRELIADIITGCKTGDFINYYILLSDENEQKKFSFESLYRYGENKLTLEWKEYQIFVLYDSEKFLKLKVIEN